MKHFLHKIDAQGLFIEDVIWDDCYMPAFEGRPVMLEAEPATETSPALPDRALLDDAGEVVWAIPPRAEVPAKPRPADLIDVAPPGGMWRPKWDGKAWIEGGAAPQKTPEQIMEEIKAGCQARLDAFAISMGYDSIISLCTYSTDANPRFSTEGQAGVSARSATWSSMYALLADVQAGKEPMPTGFADVESRLPVLVRPEFS